MKILAKAIRWTSLISFPVFLLTIPNHAALAGDIGSCAESLIVDGVSKSAAAIACADALQPNDLSSCVADIKESTNIKGEDALQACYRVRRPDELANCVIDLSSGLAAEKSTMALDNCRRSLLPDRYAECTLDLTETAQIPPEEAMKSCIAAEFYPSKQDPETK
ncbi:hypothetical protein NIES4102_04750 [Chondrocystis sp. NIES-4102]|nr:hypothetical protein NIES4102_04750 [Chondrocystis sp. NIES-4102]